ncbi:MAG: hypothetical protein JNK85_10165 [Verrucomicrobiales bacterium]|nr:hypothetical protein [Verrucomicrobiales bacterium]
MQRIFSSPWTPEEYAATEAHRQILPDSVCPSCAQPTPLHRHGHYPRWVVSVLGALMRLWIARFLCPLCRRTISYLPDFALTYRLLGPDSFAAYLDGRHERPEVQSWWTLLGTYRRRFEAFGGELIRTVGAGLGLAPPLLSQGLWPWIKRAGDSLATVTRQLVTTFKVGLLRRYQCHQPAGP